MFSSFDHLIVVRVPMPSLPRVARGSRRVSLAHFGAQTRQIHTLVAFGGVFVGVRAKISAASLPFRRLDVWCMYRQGRLPGPRPNRQVKLPREDSPGVI